MEKLRFNEQRGKIAVLVVWIMLSVDVLMGLSNYFQYRMILGWENGEMYSMEAAQANDSRQIWIAVLMVIIFVVHFVTFIMWFRRAYFNLHLRVRNLEHSEGWAAGSWFVPFVNLYMPYQIMRELYLETYALLGGKKGQYPENYTTAYVGWWWSLVIVTSTASRIDSFYARGAEEIPELITSSLISAISSLLEIPAALLTVKVIGDYMKMERLLLEQESEEEALAQEQGYFSDDDRKDGHEIVASEPSL